MFGYRRLHVLLRREGWEVNHKKVYRVYVEERLQVRVVAASGSRGRRAGGYSRSML